MDNFLVFKYTSVTHLYRKLVVDIFAKIRDEELLREKRDNISRRKEHLESSLARATSINTHSYMKNNIIKI